MLLRIDWILLWRHMWAGRKWSRCCGGYCGGVFCPGPVWRDCIAGKEG